MPTTHGEFGVALASNGKVYSIGGSGTDAALSTVEEYDPATDVWTTKSNLPTARWALGVASGGDGKIYAVGPSASIRNGHGDN